MPTQVNSDRDYSQHTGRVQTLRRQVGQERRAQGNRNLHWRIVETPVDGAKDPAEGKADSDSNGRGPQELEGSLAQGELPNRRCCNGKLQRDKRSRVVHQTLAFQNADDPARYWHRLITLVAATASGGDTIAPSANAAGHGISGINQCVTPATSSIEKRTRPIARDNIARKSRRKSCQEVNKAAGYSSGGRKK